MANSDGPFADLTLRFQPVGASLWVASLPSRWGAVEFLAHGDDQRPSESNLAVIGAFLKTASDRIVALRELAKLGRLYSPIRVAVSQENRLGVQFQHRLFRRRRVFVFDDGEIEDFRIPRVAAVRLPLP